MVRGCPFPRGCIVSHGPPHHQLSRRAPFSAKRHEGQRGHAEHPHIHTSLILAVAFALANTVARPACAFGAPAAPPAARRPFAIDSRQTLTYNRVA